MRSRPRSSLGTASAAAFYVSTGPIRDGSELWFVRLRHAFANAASPHWVEPRHGLRAFAGRSGGARAAAYRAAGRHAPYWWATSNTRCSESIEAALAVRGKLDERFMLSWEQIAALRRAGHIVGAHTRYHPISRTSTRDRPGRDRRVEGGPGRRRGRTRRAFRLSHAVSDSAAFLGGYDCHHAANSGIRPPSTWLRGAVRTLESAPGPAARAGAAGHGGIHLGAASEHARVCDLKGIPPMHTVQP